MAKSGPPAVIQRGLRAGAARRAASNRPSSTAPRPGTADRGHDQGEEMPGGQVALGGEDDHCGDVQEKEHAYEPIDRVSAMPVHADHGKHHQQADPVPVGLGELQPKRPTAAGYPRCRVVWPGSLGASDMAWPPGSCHWEKGDKSNFPAASDAAGRGPLLRKKVDLSPSPLGRPDSRSTAA